MSLDEILAVIQLSGESLRFKCRYCDSTHISGWHSCYKKLKERQRRLYHYNRDFPNTAVLSLEELSNGITAIPMPKIYTFVPRIFPYKVALQPDKFVPLLKAYAGLYSSIPDPPSIKVFDRRVPISLMLSSERYRELVHRLMDWPQYQDYVAHLTELIQSITDFIVEHTDLFVPSISNRVEVYFDKLRRSDGPLFSDIIVILPDGKAVSFNSMLSRTNIQGHELYYVLHDSYDMTLDGALSGSLLVRPGKPGCYSGDGYSCQMQLPAIIDGFKFAFDVNSLQETPPKHIDRTDPITARLQEICDKLGQIARPAFEAIMKAYATGIHRALCSGEV